MIWELQFTPSETEQLRALRCVQGKLLRAARGDWRVRAWTTAIALLAGIAGFAATVFGDGMSQAAGSFFLYGMLGALLLQAIYAITLNSAVYKSAIAADPALYTGPRTLGFDEAAITLRWECGEMRFQWDAVSSLEHLDDIAVLLVGAHYLMVPGRVFDSREDYQAWLDFISARIADPVKAGRGSPVQAVARGARRVFGSLAANLWAGLRLALFRPVDVAELQATPAALLGLTLFWIALHIAADFAATGSAGHFSPEGLPGLLFPLGLLVAAAVLAVGLGRCPERLLTALTLLLASATPITALSLVEQVLALDWDEADLGSSLRVSHIAPYWLVLAAALPMARWLGYRRARRAAWLAGLWVMLALPLIWVQRTDALWVPVDGDGYGAKYDALTSEDAFYEQPRLLEQALDRLSPERPGVTDLYFVGVGGDAEQGVFLREIRSVTSQMDRQFGTAARSIALVNNYHAAMEYPIASVTALEASLQRVGELMDKDHDILFLFLTSHGASDHEFALDFWPLKFKHLYPDDLREMLDRSGIKWRVIVVSACYSGGYIDPLRDPHSIVITAAAADKTSFGCADENDWTYFGRAFFNEALTQGEGDLDRAFAEARNIIAQREKEEGIDDASNPQIAAGEDMSRKWKAFLDERKASPPPEAAIEQATDGFDALIERLRVTEQLPAFRRECEQQLKDYEPSALVARKPGAFGGITPESAEWKPLLRAWDDYVATYCRLSDETPFRSTYAQAWRDSASPDEVANFADWLAEPAGGAFIDAQIRADQLVRQRIDQTRMPAIADAQNQFQKVAAELIAKFKSTPTAP